jgi:hypothetical protein
VRLRKPAPSELPSGLPPDLTRGPDPRVWCPYHRGELDRGLSESFCDYRARQAWRAAGDAWSVQHGLGRGEWRALLPGDVKYAVSALGRAHRMHGGLVAPWEKTHPPGRTKLAP